MLKKTSTLKNYKIQILRVVIGLNQGGVQQALLNLAKNLDKTKFELIVCAIENGGLIGVYVGTLNAKDTAGFDLNTVTCQAMPVN